MKQNRNIRIALCQINPTVGDLKGNTSKIIDNINKCRELGADIAVFPELAVTGYPPEDLLLKKDFIEANLSCLKEIAKHCSKIFVIVGFVNKKGGKLYNSAAVIKDRKISAVYNKVCLPNYGVFDEKRYFSAGSKIHKFKHGKFSVGLCICEDIWCEKGPAFKLAKEKVDLLIVINASPYSVEKWKDREKQAKLLVKNKRTAVAYLNLAGGQDELVFDGHSFVMGPRGKVLARGKQFEEDIIIFELNRPPAPCTLTTYPYPRLAEIFAALCLGLKDYVRKNGFTKVILGLSGGIDSALVAAIAVDALGKENVKAVFMPSRYSSEQSLADAMLLSQNLGIECMEIGIQKIFEGYLEELGHYFRELPENIAEENLQARIRGNLLMAFSNKFGYLVLATGNKSEVSTGYATLYGDMAGGLSVIKDVPKTLVYELARYRNSESSVIPQTIIERAPTAELRPNQKDQDTLPPYDVLDRIIDGYVEKDKSAGEIAKNGISKGTVERTVRLIDRNEYKRRQSAPGIKITPKAFGKDRRLPVTNRYSI